MSFFDLPRKLCEKPFVLGIPIEVGGEDQGYDGDSDELASDSDLDNASITEYLAMEAFYPRYYYYHSHPEHPLTQHANISVLLIESDYKTLTLP